MLFSFHCPACKGKIEADAALSGSQSPCPHCAAPVAIPESRVGAGTTLAGFRLERRLGKGGMGEVYLAQQLSVKRQVAVKILPPGFASNADAIQRFMHEGRLAARLDHANIVTVHEAGEDSGHFYLAMAYIEGESLDQRLKRDKVLPEAEALTILRTIADALAYAWDTFQLLHRDLKPANIMVDHRKRVFLMDLGLAKSVGEESGMTLSGSVVGTPQYMSPEQAQGLADLGVPTDVYALGATLYHLVTGAPPFTGETTLTVLHKHMYEPLPPPRSRNPKVTDACSVLIETMMAKAPAARYGDWRALIADIDRVLQGKAPSAQRPGAGASVVIPARAADGTHPAGASAVSPAISKARMARQAQQTLARQHQAQQAAVTPPVPTATKRPPWLAIGLTAAVLVVLALVSVLVRSRHGQAPAPGSQAVAAKPPAPVPSTGVTDNPAAATVPAVAQSATPAEPEPMQSATAATSAASPVLGEAWTVPDLGLELVWAAPGRFQMGSNEATEGPVHTVRISRGYWVGRYEATQAEYAAIMGKTPSRFRGTRNPVEQVSWHDAGEFCAKLTEREQKAGRLPQGYEYRLPTEAEWEYAARGGVQSRPSAAGPEPGFTFSGSNAADAVAWYQLNSGGTTHPVGQKQPNELGLYDLSGNVWEWCLDSCEFSDGTITDTYCDGVTDPICRQGSARVARGGGWEDDAGRCRSARREGPKPGYTAHFLGFRVGLAATVPAAVARPSTAAVPAAATPAPSVTAASAAPVAPAATPDPAQAMLAALLEDVAADLAAGRLADALRHWQAGCSAPELQPLAEQLTAIGKPLGEVTSLPQHLIESFQADIGRTIEIELAKGKVTCELREITTAGIKVNQIVRQGQGTGKLGRSIALGELSLQERLRRLGAGDTPELNLQRGLLALEVGRPDNARRLFQTAGGPLGQALAAELDRRQARAAEVAAEQGLTDLLRQISGSTNLGRPAEVTSAIRKRCEGDLKRVQTARKLLAEFEREWGRLETGKAWVPVIREALTYPWPGDAPLSIPDLGLELVPVPGGTFQMGSNEGNADAAPMHTVHISHGFWLARTEVTQRQYELATGRKPAEHDGPNSPVERVSWQDAADYCRAVTQREGAAGRLPAGWEYRLPTEAEWEYAARGGPASQGFLYAGSDRVDEAAWYGANSGGTTHPVGSRRANELGLQDMSGNVSEWCMDWYGEAYYGHCPRTDPVNLQAADSRVRRGGCWIDAPAYVRSVTRFKEEPHGVFGYLGFRACLGPRIDGR